MTLRPLATILQELVASTKTLAGQQLPFDVELEMAERALQAGTVPRIFRALEVLILAAHASGLTQRPELRQTPAYRETLQVLKMGDIPLPTDL